MSGTIYDHRNPTWLISSNPLSWDKLHHHHLGIPLTGLINILLLLL